jgi:uroporphyrinogen-III synthase
VCFSGHSSYKVVKGALAGGFYDWVVFFSSDGTNFFFRLAD